MQRRMRQTFWSRNEKSVGVISVTGPVTIETMRELRAGKVIAVCRGARRLLCDLSAAIVLMDGDDWKTFSEESLVEVPVGYVVGAEAQQLAWDHCERMADKGRICLVFNAWQDAYAWAGVERGVPPPAPPALPGRGGKLPDSPSRWQTSASPRR